MTWWKYKLFEILGSDRDLSNVKQRVRWHCLLFREVYFYWSLKTRYQGFSSTWHFLWDVNKAHIVEFGTLSTLTSCLAEGESEERNKWTAERVGKTIERCVDNSLVDNLHRRHCPAYWWWPLNAWADTFSIARRIRSGNMNIAWLKLWHRTTDGPTVLPCV